MAVQHQDYKFDIPALIDLELFFEKDEKLAPHKRAAQDRDIGQKIEAEKKPDNEAILAWLETRRAEDPEQSLQQQTKDALSALSYTLLCLGIVMGAASVLSRFMHASINARSTWLILVGPLWFFICLSILHRLSLFGPKMMKWPDKLAGYIPKIGRPIKWLYLRANPSKGRDGWDKQIAVFQNRYKRIYTCQLICWLHRFMLSYTVTILIAWWIVPKYQHPEFYWQGQDTETAHVAEYARILSTPWRWCKPDAVPTEQDVALTRRVPFPDNVHIEVDNNADRVRLADDRTRASRAWSDYLFWSILVYGLIPRVIFSGLSRWSLSSAIRQLSLDTQRFKALLGRMRTPLVDRPELPPPPPPPEVPVSISESHLIDSCLVLSALGMEPERLKSGLISTGVGQVRGVLEIGDLEMKGDEQALAALDEFSTDDEIVIVVLGSTLPLGEDLFLVREIRKKVGDNRFIHVLPCEVDADGNLQPADHDATGIWGRKLGRLLPDEYLALCILSPGTVL